jgi:hypothetical protein
MSAPMPDLSKRAVDMAVLAGSLQHPAVVYPAAAGVIGGLGVALVAASPLMIAGAVAGGGIAAVALGVNYLFRRDYFATRYIEAAHQNLVEYRKALLQNLEQDLTQVKAKEAIAQLDRFAEKLRIFEDVLDDKLDRKEITFARFMGIAEQVYLSGLDNLRQVASVRKSAGGVDEAYIRNRIKQLKLGGGELSKAKRDELASLEKQLELAAKHSNSVEALLAQNEQALAQFDQALAAVAEMKTGSTHSSVSMETAMSDLQHIASRAGAYSTTRA